MVFHGRMLAASSISMMCILEELAESGSRSIQTTFLRAIVVGLIFRLQFFPLSLCGTCWESY